MSNSEVLRESLFELVAKVGVGPIWVAKCLTQVASLSIVGRVWIRPSPIGHVAVSFRSSEE